MIINKRLYRNFILNRIFANAYKPNPLEIPYISNRYITPTWDINDDVILDMYTCDYYQTDFMCEPPIYQDFTLILNLDGNISYHSIKSGDLHLNIGKQTKGEHWFTAQVKDKHGRVSHEIYEEFRVIDTITYNQEIENNTYIATDSDLITYGISKNDSESEALATKRGLQKLMDDKAVTGVRKLVLPTGIYQIETEFVYLLTDMNINPNNYTSEQKEVAIQYAKNPLSIPNNFILDLNGSTIKSKESLYWQNNSLLMTIEDKYDSHVVNGTFEGDYRRRDLTNLSNGHPRGEHGSCFEIKGNSKYCSYENCNIKLFTGYCCSMTNGGATYTYDEFKNFKNVNVDNVGNEVFEENKWTSDYFVVGEVFKDSKVFSIGQFMGNGWYMPTDSWYIDCHFYDKDKKYIKTVHGFQYRNILKPSNAKYVRCTYYCETTEERLDVNNYLTGLKNMLVEYYNPRNCAFKNLHFDDTRTCGLNPNHGNNNLIEGCTFANCATNITPVAVDFEDGWYWMQDYMFRNNKILIPTGTGDIVIVAGMNLMFVENDNFRIGVQGNYGVGYYFEGNTNTKTMVIKYNDKTYPFLHYGHNHFSGEGIIDFREVTKSMILRDSNYFETCVPAVPNGGYYKNCIFDFNDKVSDISHTVYSLPRGKVVGSTIKNFSAWDRTKTKIYDCEYNNCTIENIKATINGLPSIMDKCVLNNVNLIYDNMNGELIIKNSTLTNFNFDSSGTWKNSIIKVTLENCIIDNSNSANGLNIFKENFAWEQNIPDKKFFTIKNCTLLNGTNISSSNSLANNNIIWTIESNQYL